MINIFIAGFVIIIFLAVIVMFLSRKKYSKSYQQVAQDENATPTGSVFPGVKKIIDGREVSVQTSGSTIVLKTTITEETPLRGIYIVKNQFLNQWQSPPPGNVKVTLGDPEVDKTLLIYVAQDNQDKTVAFLQQNLEILKQIVELSKTQFNLGVTMWESKGTFIFNYEEQNIAQDKVTSISEQMLSIFEQIMARIKS